MPNEKIRPRAPCRAPRFIVSNKLSHSISNPDRSPFSNPGINSTEKIKPTSFPCSAIQTTSTPSPQVKPLPPHPANPEISVSSLRLPRFLWFRALVLLQAAHHRPAFVIGPRLVPLI